jgi:hypothetical protein
MEFGEMPPDILRMRANISTLMDCKHEVQLALVAWLQDDTTGRMTDSRIEKSNLFSPVSEQRELQMRVTQASCAEQRQNMKSDLSWWPFPPVVTPSGWSKVTTVNQVVRNGGAVIEESLFSFRCQCAGKRACSTSLERFPVPGTDIR